MHNQAYDGNRPVGPNEQRLIDGALEGVFLAELHSVLASPPSVSLLKACERVEATAIADHEIDAWAKRLGNDLAAIDD